MNPLSLDITKQLKAIDKKLIKKNLLHPLTILTIGSFAVIEYQFQFFSHQLRRFYFSVNGEYLASENIRNYHNVYKSYDIVDKIFPCKRSSPTFDTNANLELIKRNIHEKKSKNFKQEEKLYNTVITTFAVSILVVGFARKNKDFFQTAVKFKNIFTSELQVLLFEPVPSHFIGRSVFLTSQVFFSAINNLSFVVQYLPPFISDFSLAFDESSSDGNKILISLKKLIINFFDENRDFKYDILEIVCLLIFTNKMWKHLILKNLLNKKSSSHSPLKAHNVKLKTQLYHHTHILPKEAFPQFDEFLLPSDPNRVFFVSSECYKDTQSFLHAYDRTLNSELSFGNEAPTFFYFDLASFAGVNLSGSNRDDISNWSLQVDDYIEYIMQSKYPVIVIQSQDLLTHPNYKTLFTDLVGRLSLIPSAKVVAAIPHTDNNPAILNSFLEHTTVASHYQHGTIPIEFKNHIRQRVFRLEHLMCLPQQAYEQEQGSYLEGLADTVKEKVRASRKGNALAAFEVSPSEMAPWLDHQMEIFHTMMENKLYEYSKKDPGVKALRAELFCILKEIDQFEDKSYHECMEVLKIIEQLGIKQNLQEDRDRLEKHPKYQALIASISRKLELFIPDMIKKVQEIKAEVQEIIEKDEPNFSFDFLEYLRNLS